MEPEHVTRREFDNHLILIHESIRQSNERTDLHFTKVVDEVSLMRKSQDKILDKIDKTLDQIAPRVTDLEKNQATNNAYWKISGGVLLVLLAAVVGLGFDRLTTSPQHTQPQPQAAQAGIRL